MSNAAVSLVSFVKSVNARAMALTSDERFPEDQRALLRETLQRLTSHCEPSDPAQPLSLLYFVFRATGRSPDEQAEHVAAFCLLYLASLDLFDDMQDDDLAGTPHAADGPAVAVNSAIALMFLSLDELRRAIGLEVEPSVRERYFSTFTRIALVTVGAQHADLVGQEQGSTRADVLRMHRGKTASTALLLECGALLGRGDASTCAVYGEIGQKLASLIQIVDDVRDIYGKDISPDLAARKATYPLASFREIAPPDALAQLDELLSETLVPLERIRELLHESGAIDLCAKDLEEIRVDIHRSIASLANPCAEHRVLLSVVDTVASTVYELEPVPETQALWQPTGGFHDRVRQGARTFFEVLARHGAPSAPPIEPWSQPFFLFDPERNVVYYPDVDDLPGEVLPFHAELWRVSPDEVAGTLERLAPLLMAHELFHVWRHSAARLEADAWHEEYVANRLTVGFALAHFPNEVMEARELAARVVAQHLLSDEACRLLDEARTVSSERTDYGVSPETAALMHWEMVRRLVEEGPTFADDVTEYLG
jgi:geranylgeranyl pyrophosphate synthase